MSSIRELKYRRKIYKYISDIKYLPHKEIEDKYENIFASNDETKKSEALAELLQYEQMMNDPYNSWHHYTDDYYRYDSEGYNVYTGDD
jgi:hypothetical protein